MLLQFWYFFAKSIACRPQAFTNQRDTTTVPSGSSRRTSNPSRIPLADLQWLRYTMISPASVKSVAKPYIKQWESRMPVLGEQKTSLALSMGSPSAMACESRKWKSSQPFACPACCNWTSLSDCSGICATIHFPVFLWANPCDLQQSHRRWRAPV